MAEKEIRSAGDPDATTAADIDWLIDQGLRKTPPPEVLTGVAERLSARGVPLERVMASTYTLHPSVEAAQFQWNRDGGAARSSVERQVSESEAWRQSPIRHMLQDGVHRLRRRLTGSDANLDFPVLRDFRDEGFTDYFGRLYGFRDPDDPNGRRSGAVTRWLTRRDGGFTDDDLAAIDRLLPAFCLAIQASLDREIAINLLDAYVGPVAGRRILAGEIQRGSAESIDAMLMIADLSGFTAMSDTTPLVETVATLNRFLDAMVGPVLDHGGQILKYLGDGFLAIFPTRPGEEAERARQALAAAEDALAATSSLNEVRAAVGERAMALTVVLHAGAVMFGIIGARDRLDFTVVGPAVNEASRMEALSKQLGRHLVVSDDVARFLDPGRLPFIGEHTLRGIEGSLKLYGYR